MSRSFQLNAGQSAIASLNERTIYIKVSDAVNYTVYESNIELKELRLSLDLEDAYKIIVKCLEGSKGSSGCLEGSKGAGASEGSYNGDYRVITSVNTGIMKMAFSARVEGFLKINFDIILKEKIMSNDGQLTLSMNRIEQKQTMAIEELTKKCADLEETITKQQQNFVEQLEFLKGVINGIDIFTSPSHHWTAVAQTQFTANIASTELTLNGDGCFNAKSIASFYQLKKLTINGFSSQSTLGGTCSSPGRPIALSGMHNKTLKEMILNCSGGTFTSLQGIHGFPNLEILTVTCAPGLTNVVSMLSQTKHTIKTLKFQTCAAVNVVELQTYCQVNGIFLALS
jgi:hypothetical protein